MEDATVFTRRDVTVRSVKGLSVNLLRDGGEISVGYNARMDALRTYIKPCLCAAMLLLFVRTWLTVVPYEMDSLGSGDWTMVFSNASRGVLPLLIVAMLRCRPLSKKTVTIVSSAISLIIFGIAGLLLFSELALAGVSYIVVICIWSGCIGWYYNLVGAMLIRLPLGAMGLSAFLGVAMVNAEIVVTLPEPRVLHWFTMVTIVLALILVVRCPWDETKDQGCQKSESSVGSIYISDIAITLLPIILYCLAWGAMNSDPFRLNRELNSLALAFGRVIQCLYAATCCIWIARRPSAATLRRIFAVVVIGSTVGLALEMLPEQFAACTGHALFLGFSGITPSVWLVLAGILAGQMRFPAYASYAFLEPALLVTLAVGHALGFLITGNEVLTAAFMSCCIVLLTLSIAAMPQMERCLATYSRSEKYRESKEKGYLARNTSRSEDGMAILKLGEYGLTERELDIAMLLCKGRTYESCARLLGISINTTRTHIRRMYGKLGITSKEELIDLAEGRSAE